MKSIYDSLARLGCRVFLGVTSLTAAAAEKPWDAELVAVARLPADLRDGRGDTFGSISALAITDWASLADGGFSGRLITLPDRGYNRPEERFYSDYPARLESLRLVLTPGSTAAASWSVQLDELRTDLLLDERGEVFTGLDPVAGRGVVIAGREAVFPVAAGGRTSLDAEGLAIAADGTTYVSDEYMPAVYVFGADRVLRGVIVPPAALLPRAEGRLQFTSTEAPVSGRRNNQGLEGLGLSPDGTRLFALTQSALMQDTAAPHASRRWARLLVYDVSGEKAPAAPVAHYVLELPLHGKTAGAKLDRTAGQSELLALANDRIVVLARDNLGAGSGEKRPPVLKALFVYEITAAATNLAGTPAEAGPEGRVALNGELLPGVMPLRGRMVLDLLDPAALARHGLHLDPAGDPAGYLSEKWEALGLVPGGRAGECFLFVGNDNDFQTRRGHMSGRDYDAGAENDTRVLIYRVRLPR